MCQTIVLVRQQGPECTGFNSACQRVEDKNNACTDETLAAFTQVRNLLLGGEMAYLALFLF